MATTAGRGVVSTEHMWDWEARSALATAECSLHSAAENRLLIESSPRTRTTSVSAEATESRFAGSKQGQKERGMGHTPYPITHR